LRYFERQKKIWTKYWSELKEERAAGRAAKCFAAQWMDEEQDSKQRIDDELQAAFVAGCQ
jgi:hypothetical protein